MASNNFDTIRKGGASRLDPNIDGNLPTQGFSI
jgi:hypothetical protein